MQSKPYAFLAAAAIAALIAAGCSNNKGGSSQTTTTTTTTTETSQPVAEATSAATTGTTTTTTTTTETTLPSAAPSGAATTSSASNTVAATGDSAKGKTVFTANCASCHGATGTEGGVGPSLKNEKSRKNYQQTVAWIKNPQPPMPKLFPSPLSEQDVDNVAAYVQTL